MTVRPMKVCKGLTILWMTALMVAALSANVIASSYQLRYNTNVSDDDYISTTKTPRGRTGEPISIFFRVRVTDEDMGNLKVSLQRTNDSQQIEERGNGDYTVNYYLFEIIETTSLVKSVGNIEKGDIKSVSLPANVRRDAQQGHYSIPICLEWDDGSDTNYINVWILTDASLGADGKEGTKEGNYFVIGENQSIPRSVYPNVMDYTINFRNRRSTTAQDVTASIQLSEDDTKFPFEIDDGNYDRTFERVQSDRTVPASYSMVVRKDSYSGYYPIKYTTTFCLGSEGDLHREEGTFYVHIIPKDKKDSLRDFDANDRTKARFIVDSYYTAPEQIFIGDKFELVLSMKNVPTSVPANNIPFNLELEKVPDSVTFTTGSGSSSMVVNDLGAGRSIEVRAKFTTRAGMNQCPYAITTKEKYDSPKFRNVEESIVVDTPVKQYTKLGASITDVMSDSMTVGSESNAMFGINNMGKVIPYNVTITFESDSIKTTDAYVGNIKPGETGNVDVMLIGINPTMDDGTVEILISYEGENGMAADPAVKKLTLFITEEVDESPGMNMDMEAGAMDTQAGPSSRSKYKVLTIAGVVAAAGTGMTAVVVIRKKRRAAKEEDADDEIS